MQRGDGAGPGTAAQAFLIGDEDIKGVDKWLGGELGADGMIYGVSGSAKSILRVNPENDEVTLVGHNVKGVPCSQKRGQFKWLRGARMESGDTIGVPSNADCILRISATGDVSTFGDRDLLSGFWKWHGGILAPNGSLYACPCNSDRVLKIAPDTLDVSLVGEPYTGKNKWYGALLGHDGCMYCVPNCSRHVLRFDTESETTSLLGDLPEGDGSGTEAQSVAMEMYIACLLTLPQCSKYASGRERSSRSAKAYPPQSTSGAEHAPIARVKLSFFLPTLAAC